MLSSIPKNVIKLVITTLFSINIVTAADDTTPPSPPRAISTEAVSEKLVTLSWLESNDASGIKLYNIFRDSILVGSTIQNEFNDNGLQAGTSYAYTLTAVDGANNESTPSGVRNVTTLDTTPPTAPQLSAIGISEKQIQLTWQGASDNVAINRYQIYRDGQLRTNTSNTTFSDDFLAPATLYSYDVITEDTSGNLSNPAQIVISTLDTTPPSIPQQLSAIAISEKRVDLSWSASSDASDMINYKVFRNDILIKTVPATKFTDTGLQAGVQYSYALTAIDSFGNESNFSSIRSVTTLDLTRPSAPQLSAVATSEKQIQLSWQGATDNVAIKRYQIFRDGQLRSNTSETNFSDDFLSPATIYSYDVITEDTSGNLSIPAKVVLSTLDTTLPSQPKQLMGNAISSNQIDLNWQEANDNIEVSFYNVYRDGILYATATNTTFSDTELNALTSYEYAVSAVDGVDNESLLSDSVTIFTQMANNLTELPTGILSVIGVDVQVTADVADSPLIIGLTILEMWQNIEITEGVYDWSKLDQKVQEAVNAGKLIRLSINHGGENTPEWVYDLGVDTFISPDSGVRMPAFWDPIFLSKKKNFIRAIAEHFEDNHNIFSISLPCVNATTGDWSIPSKSEAEKLTWLALGYTPNKLVNACKQVIDSGMDAFPNKWLATSVGATMIDDEDNLQVAGDILDYAEATYPGRLVAMTGSLGTSTALPEDIADNLTWHLFKEYSPTAAQTVWSATDTSECRLNGFISPCDPITTLEKALAIGIAYDTSYLEVYTVDVTNPDLFDVILQAADILSQPQVSIISPSNKTSVQGQTIITIDAIDMFGVNRVDLFQDEELLARLRKVPYQFEWNTTNLANGRYKLIAKAFDQAGNSTTSKEVSVRVNNN